MSDTRDLLKDLSSRESVTQKNTGVPRSHALRGNAVKARCTANYA